MGTWSSLVYGACLENENRRQQLLSKHDVGLSVYTPLVRLTLPGASIWEGQHFTVAQTISLAIAVWIRRVQYQVEPRFPKSPGNRTLKTKQVSLGAS